MREADLCIKSIPRNPLLFCILHRMEAVERIGSGIRRIRDLCREYGVAEPLIEVSESWVTTAFQRPTSELGTRTGLMQGSGESPARVKAPRRHQVQILRNCLTEKAIGTLMASVRRKDRTKFRNQVLKPLLQAGWLEMTIPDKPTSSKQKYRVTYKGRQLPVGVERERCPKPAHGLRRWSKRG